jgi:outer membrane protein OmpA-like peptidoglycan-associated protein
MGGIAMARTIAATLVLFVAAHAAQAQHKASPVINIKVSKSVTAITYRTKASTKVDFRGTALQPRAEGKAQVESKEGRTLIDAQFSKLDPALNLGPEYLTYVLWAISPEGRPVNLGEVMLDQDKASLKVTSRLQAFAMIVTAEPYYAVSIPSEMVVLENFARQDTKGTADYVDAKFELLKRGRYEEAGLKATRIDPKTPLELYQARNAMQVAKWQEADRLAADSYQKALAALNQAEDYNTRKQRKPAIATAREAAQLAEDARVIAEKRGEEERLEQERREADEREAQAKAEAEAETRRRAEAENQRKLEEEARRRAELERIVAEKEKAEADKKRMEAELEANKAAAREREAAEAARQAREAADKAEREKQELRQNLLDQLNRILPTKDTPRGLQVTMADILFDSGRFNLRPGAREALARLSGIILAHPGLKLEVEGHTDNVGSDAFNQTLSEKRSGAVRDYLTNQGLGADSVTAKGFGETMPIAENTTAQGRQQNRRVEIIVSGEAIGTKLR